MQTLSQKKLFLVFVGCLVIFALFFGSDISVRAAPSQPPAEANCTLEKDTSVFPENTYKCPKNGQIPAGAIQMPVTPVRECVNKCSDGEGAILLYPPAGAFKSQTAYCYNIQSDRICKIDGEYTSLMTGTVTTEEQAKEINPDSCGVFGGLCSLLETLFGGVAGLLNLVIAPVASLLGLIVETLAASMNKVISYVITVPISPSSPDMKPDFFVRAIWDYSRAFANNFFVLLLAIIGLATILRVQTYQWQKLLPSLIIAILLINFSGVFVGFVVDMANIVTSALLADSVEKTNWGQFKIGGTESLALNVGRIIFYFVIAFAYLATMLLFVIRTIALWIIAGIAPLAFALYVLPATNTYWQQWFKALFQWAIMGIPISFALFFASKAMTLTIEGVGRGSPPAFFAEVAGPFTAAV
ncbi:MAG: hypothetical protein Q7K38_03620, partial [Candidatus Wildermuthbacteria bacterium]|nr:hypothetical protein [Candidatus Wildermuthbacteria bacterium]